MEGTKTMGHEDISLAMESILCKIPLLLMPLVIVVLLVVSAGLALAAVLVTVGGYLLALGMGLAYRFGRLLRL